MRPPSKWSLPQLYLLPPTKAHSAAALRATVYDKKWLELISSPKELGELPTAQFVFDCPLVDFQDIPNDGWQCFI